ncbi:carboxypeptidase regulatory-like domain-containing protein [bacterium]|nr:carboxypeptidase regulatory-like domain-containing protein [bacterium]
MRKNTLMRFLSILSLTALFVTSLMTSGCDDSKSKKGATISGTVLNSSGDPIADVKVDLVLTTIVQTMNTGANGAYVFEDVDDGSYQIILTKANYVNDTLTVTIADRTNPAPLSSLFIRTDEQTGTVSGNITSGASNVDGATVSIPALGKTTTTNASGAYSLNNVLIGTHEVIVTKNGYVTDSASVNVTANATSMHNFILTEQVTLTGTLVGTLTLDPAKSYVLSGPYLVSPGAILNIPAGTVIKAKAGTQAVIIAVRATASNASTVTQRNGKIYAMGTSGNPVVFTTEVAAGGRSRGLWGGIVLNGVATINVPGGIGVGEGNTGSYGPGFGSFTLNSSIGDTMMSGEFHYVRVEYGGIKVTPDNEVNGWTFNGVGSNTVLDHIQSHMIADDGFEWFGGTVRGKYLVASGCDDDMFDTDFGTQVKIQYAFGIQDKALANRGMEADNDASGSSNSPISKPTFWNFTFIGGNDVDDKNNDDNNEGMYWRRNTQYDANNGIVAYFNRIGLTLDGTADSSNAANGTATAKNIIMFNNKSNNPKNIFEVALKTTAQNYDTAGLRSIIESWNILVQNPNFTAVTTAANANPMDNNMPDPRPTVNVTGGTPPNDNFFDVAATYIGAFKSGDPNWLSGWTNWAKQ